METFLSPNLSTRSSPPPLRSWDKVTSVKQTAQHKTHFKPSEEVKTSFPSNDWIWSVLTGGVCSGLAQWLEQTYVNIFPKRLQHHLGSVCNMNIYLTYRTRTGSGHVVTCVYLPFSGPNINSDYTTAPHSSTQVFEKYFLRLQVYRIYYYCLKGNMALI